MPVQICVYCGSPFPGRATAKYCNRDCYYKSCKEETAAKDNQPAVEVYINACRFNDGVVCLDQEHCNKCGWNPWIAQQRLARILSRWLDVEVLTDGE